MEVSTWGGLRKGAGRKNLYGKSVVIRIPEKCKDDVRKVINNYLVSKDNKDES